MSRLNAFELICYVIVALMLLDLIRKRDYNGLFTFGAAAIVGFSMELLAVSVTDIYYYSDNFWLSLGKAPRQFPVFGGLMWGGLTVYDMELAKKHGFDKGLTALCTGMFIVTMDILLDVIAIRMDGGFWTWVGRPISTMITQHTFMSVIWVNFLGYMIETPTVAWLVLKKNEKVPAKDFLKQTYFMFLIALGGIVVTSIGSLVSLFLNSVTDDRFSCIAFLVLWTSLAVLILLRSVRSRIRILPVRRWNISPIIFWSALYAYCIEGILYLNIGQTQPWFPVIAFIFAFSTLFFCIAEPVRGEVNRNERI
jgi:hypothetical protein